MTPRKSGGGKPGRSSGPASSRGRPKKVPAAERRSVEGWRRLPGKAKQYRNTETGETLSNRQYRQRFLYGSGKTLEQVAKQRGSPRRGYNRLLRARQDYLADHGIKASLQDIRQSDAMKSITRDLRKRRMGQLTAYERRELKKRNPAAYELYKKMYGPDSDLAKALADLGYRDPDSRAWVGDS